MKVIKVLPAMLVTLTLCGTVAFSAGNSIPSPISSINAQQALQDIDTQLNMLREQEEKAVISQVKIQQQIESTKSDKASQENLLRSLRLDLEAQESRYADISSRFESASAELINALSEVKQANDRVKSRSQANAARIRFLYMQGNSYLIDLIVRVKNFSDFLSFMGFMEQVVKVDQEIASKNNVDLQLASVKASEAQKIFQTSKEYLAQSTSLRVSIQQSEVMLGKILTNLDQKQQDLEHSSEEHEKALIELTRKRSDLYNKKRQIQNVNYSASFTGGAFVWPVQGGGVVSSPFEESVDRPSPHKGFDIAAPGGTSILAAQSGVVLISSWVKGYGNTVVVETGKGMQNWYGHIRDGGLFVREGQIVNAGDKIAEVGSTGNSTGNHLHFEVRIDDKPVDPEPFLRGIVGQPVVTKDLQGNTITVTPETAPAMAVPQTVQGNAPAYVPSQSSVISKPVESSTTDNVSRAAPKK